MNADFRSSPLSHSFRAEVHVFLAKSAIDGT
jgi:hypothetical protein